MGLVVAIFTDLKLGHAKSFTTLPAIFKLQDLDKYWSNHEKLLWCTWYRLIEIFIAACVGLQRQNVTCRQQACVVNIVCDPVEGIIVWTASGVIVWCMVQSTIYPNVYELFVLTQHCIAIVLQRWVHNHQQCVCDSEATMNEWEKETTISYTPLWAGVLDVVNCGMQCFSSLLVCRGCSIS